MIYYLIPCTVDYAEFRLAATITQLEPYYVIADWQEMQRVWYGEEDGHDATTRAVWRVLGGLGPMSTFRFCELLTAHTAARL